jgi:hypothetical protein
VTNYYIISVIMAINHVNIDPELQTDGFVRVEVKKTITLE